MCISLRTVRICMCNVWLTAVSVTDVSSIWDMFLCWHVAVYWCETEFRLRHVVVLTCFCDRWRSSRLLLRSVWQIQCTRSRAAWAESWRSLWPVWSSVLSAHRRNDSPPVGQLSDVQQFTNCTQFICVTDSCQWAVDGRQMSSCFVCYIVYRHCGI